MKLNRDKRFFERVVLSSIALIIVAFIIHNFDYITKKSTDVISTLNPFFIAIFISYLLSRPVNILEKKLKIKRIFIVSAIYTILLIALVVGTAYTIPLITENASKLASDLNSNPESLIPDFSKLNLGGFQDVVNKNINRITDALSQFSNLIIKSISDILLQITSTFINFLLGLIISIYMIIDKEKIIKSFKTLNEIVLDKEKSEIVHDFFMDVNEVFSKFLTGLLSEAFIVSIFSYIIMLILQVRYAPVLAVIMFLCYLVPTIGFTIGMIPALLSTLLYDPSRAIWLGIALIILMQIDGNFIAPKLMGSSVGLAPFWILFSILFFGSLMGFSGLILAIPFGAIVKITLNSYIERKRKENKAGEK